MALPDIRLLQSVFYAPSQTPSRTVGFAKGSDPFVPPPPPDEAEVAAMFERLSQDTSVSRREALNRVAVTYAMSNKAVYAIIERLKISGK